MPSLPMVDAGAGVALRAWRAEDAPALAAAWADPDIARYATVPADASEGAATRWIGGAALRAEAGLSLDLVVGPAGGDQVWGEVGVARLRLRARSAAAEEVNGGGPVGLEAGARPAVGLEAGARSGAAVERTVWDVGWWIVRAQRGRGVASVAARLLVGWARDEAGLGPLVARIRPGHLASEGVAARAGFVRRGRWDRGHDLWMQPPQGS